MKRKALFTFIFLLLPPAMIFAQGQKASLNLSLKQAQEYAVANNKVVKSAKLDVIPQGQHYGKLYLLLCRVSKAQVLLQITLNS